MRESESEPGLRQVEEPGQQLAAGEVSRCPAQHEHVRADRGHCPAPYADARPRRADRVSTYDAPAMGLRGDARIVGFAERPAERKFTGTPR